MIYQKHEMALWVHGFCLYVGGDEITSGTEQ